MNLSGIRYLIILLNCSFVIACGCDHTVNLQLLKNDGNNIERLAIRVHINGRSLNLALDTAGFFSWAILESSTERNIYGTGVKFFRPCTDHVLLRKTTYYVDAAIEADYYANQQLSIAGRSWTLLFGGTLNTAQGPNSNERFFKHSEISSGVVGTLGLGPKQSANKNKTVESAYLVTRLPKKDTMFALWLSATAGKGKISFGAPLENCKQYSTELELQRVGFGIFSSSFVKEFRRFWSIELSEMSIINPADNQGKLFKNKKFVLDSGHSAITMPRDMFSAFEAVFKLGIGITFTAGVEFSCNLLEKLPEIEMQFESAGAVRKYKMYPADYIWESANTGQCTPRISSVPNDEALPMLGIPFFQRFYTEFHFGSGSRNKHVTVALAEKDC